MVQNSPRGTFSIFRPATAAPTFTCRPFEHIKQIIHSRAVLVSCSTSSMCLQYDTEGVASNRSKHEVQTLIFSIYLHSLPTKPLVKNLNLAGKSLRPRLVSSTWLVARTVGKLSERPARSHLRTSILWNP